MEKPNKKKRYWQIAFLLFLVMGTVLIVWQQHNTPYRKHTGFVFGTVYNISYQSDEDLRREIEAELQRVDDALSMFNERSVISRINQGEQQVDDSAEGRMFLDVFQLAMQVSADTDGAFDITVAPLVNAWGFGFKNDLMPTQHAVDSLLAFVGYRLLTVKEQGAARRIVKADERMMLDCSAIAKGYGTDAVARLLKEHGITNYMVEIGGEVVTRGISPSRVPWRIGVTKPTDDTLTVEGELQTVLNVTDRAMATSGNYRNFYYKGGRKYAHTIDPKTGHPVQHSLLSATVLAPTCAMADAYATAFMVMGMEQARKVLERHGEMAAYFIYTDARGELAVWASPQLEADIKD